MSVSDKPDPPCNLRVTETSTDFMNIAWDAPPSDGGSPLIGYVIEKRDTKRPGYIFIADVDPDVYKVRWYFKHVWQINFLIFN